MSVMCDYFHVDVMQVCMASIIRMSNGSLIFANPTSQKDRVNGMLKRRLTSANIPLILSMVAIKTDVYVNG